MKIRGSFVDRAFITFVYIVVKKLLVKIDLEKNFVIHRVLPLIIISIEKRFQMKLK